MYKACKQCTDINNCLSYFFIIVIDSNRYEDPHYRLQY